VISSGTSPNNS